MTVAQRRSSSRLQNLPDDKKPYYGDSRKRSTDVLKDTITKKKSKSQHLLREGASKKDEEDNASQRFPASDIKASDKPSTEGATALDERVTGSDERVLDLEDDDLKWQDYNKALVNVSDKSAHARVKATLRTFNVHYLHFVQEEEKRCKKAEVNAQDDPNGSKINNENASNDDAKRPSKRLDLKAVSENENAGSDDAKRPSKRPDLKAVSEMIRNNSILYPKKNFGHLPGIDVGYQFFSRAEMVAVGFHGHWLNGIDYMGNFYAKMDEYKGYTFPLAIAIVLSGQYEDDVDDSEVVVYTGQGGNDLLGNKRQIKDQVLCRGNLALKNNMEQNVPVRVIRGHGCLNSYSGKVYTYDGLYKVVNYWAEKGVAGFTVFKYRLRRLRGQPKLVTNQVHFTRGRVSKVLAELAGLLCNDISNGEEDICIPVTNEVDDAPAPSTGFKYMKSIQVAKGLSIPPSASGCNCKGNCTNEKNCSCAQLNGFDFPYVRRDGGRLIEAKDVVFECGPTCGCGPSCVNRTSQRGLKYRFEVFRTPNKGWGVRSWDFIPSGAPVCEYIGVLRRSDELDNVSGNDYIFEIDCWQTMNGIGGRERRLRDVSLPSNNHKEKTEEDILESAPEFCLDAGSCGNFARFINHSCEPNLFVQCVLSSHHDIRLARVVLFAADNIPPLQELSYDYGYELDSVIGPDGKIKKLTCHCGAASCRKRLY